MSRIRFGAPLAALAMLLLSVLPAGAQEPPPPATDGRDDAVVIAVIDGKFNPYHWNYLASKMPQATDADPSNDLPLTQSPATWLPGLDATQFASYNALPLTLEQTNPSAPTAPLDTADAAKWSSVKQSTPSNVHYYWMPGTKVVGAVDFSGGKIHGTSGEHGSGTSSVAVGNIHGSCPECLLVFISYGSCLPSHRSVCPQGEYALNWALNQPWIDAVSNSYGFSLVNRDRFYNGGNTDLQKTASERGQTIFFSSGNGQANAFDVPNTTLLSSQEGPDWTVTVGAVSPSGADYSGTGKPADIASLGSGYPAAGGTTVTSSANFSGTSNATPVVAGMYGRSLYSARRALTGPSRTQADGVVATGAPVVCGAARPDCELGDGVLTSAELRTRLFEGAIATEDGLSPAGVIGGMPTLSPEQTFVHEGHGTYFAKLGDWVGELARIFDPMVGTAPALERPEGEREWMIVDSFCRQSIWGSWGGGYYVEGVTALPGQSADWPLRSFYQTACPALSPPP